MSANIHDKIIKKAASETLAPLGLFQVGQSRCWLDDSEWFMTQVEFQPSAWSRGSYLNVGVSFLWDKTKALNEVLTFDVGYREKVPFVEFKGDEDDFYKKMIEMANRAREKVLYYRNFNDFSFCGQQLTRLAEKESRFSFWENWTMAMFCFLTNDNVTGKHYLERFIEWFIKIFPDGSQIAWHNEVIAKARELLTIDVDLTKFVLDSIYKKRSFFNNKPSYKKMKHIEELQIGKDRYDENFCFTTEN